MSADLKGLQLGLFTHARPAERQHALEEINNEALYSPALVFLASQRESFFAASLDFRNEGSPTIAGKRRTFPGYFPNHHS